jgi:hypothetical protein
MLNEEILARQIQTRAVDHMVQAVQDTVFEDEPFPHCIISNLFPCDLYAEMVDSLPEKSLYEPASYEKHAVAGASNRDRFNLTDKCLETLGRGRPRALWLGVRNALGSADFKAAVFTKLRGGLAIRFGKPADEAAHAEAYPRPELFRETKGYMIKPHPDTRKKVVTMQIALPSDDSQADLGTEFYRRSLNPMHLFREPRGFEIVKQSPFLPNMAYAFVVINSLTLKSWHGRTTLRTETSVRNTILNIWYANPADANPDLVRETRRVAA